MPTLLILTVGTGTAGRHSDLAQGLINTLQQIRPQRFWLVPSTSPDSQAIADLVREGAPPGCQFQDWIESQPYPSIQEPDDLFHCRSTLREVIRTVRPTLSPDDRLVINPTSGTKQMSVGATLAALDEAVGEIVFTVGERSEGVVMTGTERLASFDTARFFFERDLRAASALFEAGAFQAAAQLLAPHPGADAVKARKSALCMHEWQRMHYDAAARHAAGFSETLRVHLSALAKADELSLERLGDLLAGADELMNWGDTEEALARYYRGAEHAAKKRLAQEHGLRPPSNLEELRTRLPPSSSLRKELQRRNSSEDLLLTLHHAWQVLQDFRDPLADRFLADATLRTLLNRRHESLYGHGVSPVHPADVALVARRLRDLLTAELPGLGPFWSSHCRPRQLAVPVVA